MNVTVEEGVDELDTLCSYDVLISGKVLCQKIPEPRDSMRKLLEAAGVILPEVLVARGIKVATRKKLMDSRQHKRDEAVVEENAC